MGTPLDSFPQNLGRGNFSAAIIRYFMEYRVVEILPRWEPSFPSCLGNNVCCLLFFFFALKGKSNIVKHSKPDFQLVRAMVHIIFSVGSQRFTYFFKVTLTRLCFRFTPVRINFRAGSHRFTYFFVLVHKVRIVIFCRFTLTESLQQTTKSSNCIYRRGNCIPANKCRERSLDGDRTPEERVTVCGVETK